MSAMPPLVVRDQKIAAITAAFSAPFPSSEVKLKPQKINGNKALVVSYIDARLVQDRLDSVVGPENWADSYEVLGDGSVVCRLAVRFGTDTEWITKTDVGSQSEQPDGGDRLKAAFSDALKRAAVKFGIGRYLYSLPAQWMDYDPATKRLGRPKAQVATPSPAPVEQPQPKPPALPASLPAPGQEFLDRVLKLPREEMSALRQWGRGQNYSGQFERWTAEQIAAAREQIQRMRQER